MKFLEFLKSVFISKFWIKALCLIISVLVALLLNI